jgi:hypothetical protein
MVPSIGHAEEFPNEVTAPTVAGTVMAGRAATCEGASFSGDNVTITYAWYKTGAGKLADGQTYIPTRDDIGWDITCRATGTNSIGSLESYSPQYQVQDGTPNNEVSPRIVGKATPGLAVTCTTGTWSGEANTYSHQWLLDEQPIAGATKDKILVLDRFHDRELVCRVTATNASGSASMNSNTVAPFHPPILAPIAKVQPKLPRLKAAIASGIRSKLVCNATCATQSHAFMLAGDAARLGIKGKNLGGLVIVGVGRAHRTYKGELFVTTTFTASAKKGLRKLRKPVRIDLLFETSWGKRYNFREYHVASSKSIKLRP